jgi:quaternary ammonium compound-resistance protein SugE
MSTGTAWLLLIAAGVLEVSWLIAMKYADGFTKLWPTGVSVGICRHKQRPACDIE